MDHAIATTGFELYEDTKFDPEKAVAYFRTDDGAFSIETDISELKEILRDYPVFILVCGTEVYEFIAAIRYGKLN